jgi:hypothetical protein
MASKPLGRHDHEGGEEEEEEEDIMQDVDMDDAADPSAAEAEASACAWQAFCDKLTEFEPPHSSSRQNLEELRKARELREESRRSLEGSLDRQVRDRLASELSAALDRVQSSRDEWWAANEATGDDLVQRATDSHERRTRLVQQVHDSFSRFEKACRGLASGVMNEAGGLLFCGCGSDPAGEGATTIRAGNGGVGSASRNGGDNKRDSTLLVDGSIDDRQVGIQGSGDKVGASVQVASATVASIGEGGANDSSQNAKSNEPDWDAILSFEPMRESTQSLMDTKALLGQADEQLSSNLASLSATMKDCLDSLEALTDHAIGMFSEPLDAQEDEIQAGMMRNLERRIDFEVAVREQAEQSQSYFQNLMQNITCANRPDPGAE